jgi:quercetin dioxygenase-like cupin family protein
MARCRAAADPSNVKAVGVPTKGPVGWGRKTAAWPAGGGRPATHHTRTTGPAGSPHAGGLRSLTDHDTRHGEKQAMAESVTFTRWEEIPWEKVNERLDRRLITGDDVMLAHVLLRKGCVVPRHQHENEQFTYILTGALKFRIGEDGSEEAIVRAGEVLHLPSNVWHEAEALEDTLDLDIFSPPRRDWLDGTDAYLREQK